MVAEGEIAPMAQSFTRPARMTKEDWILAMSPMLRQLRMPGEGLQVHGLVRWGSLGRELRGWADQAAS